jgi:hypothetical protein
MKAQVGALRQLTSSEQDTTRPGTASSLFAPGPLFSNTEQLPETASQRLAHVVSHPVLFADEDADMAAQVSCVEAAFSAVRTLLLQGGCRGITTHT